MTASRTSPPGPLAPAGDHPDQPTLAGYAAGAVDRVAAWSVEAHLGACARCRAAVSAQEDPARLARNRAALLVRVATGDGRRARRLLSRCGVPDHLLRLLAATPSLRLSWLLSVVGVLAAVTGEAVLAIRLSVGSVGPVGPAAASYAQALVPFLVLAPLLVLATVAAAFLPVFDPAYQLAVAAPLRGLTLLLVRSLCALAAALVPVAAAAAVLPGPGWLPAALLLPSLALCTLALAFSAVLGPLAAAISAATVWVIPVLWVAAARSPLLVLQWHGQVASAAVLLAAAGVLVARRVRFDVGWTR